MGKGTARRYRWGPPSPGLWPAGAHQICHSTKRTHRFSADFFMEMAMNKWLTVEISERNRWVRFGKRTHREAYFGGVRLPRQLLRGISSDSVWKTNPPGGCFGCVFIA